MSKIVPDGFEIVTSRTTFFSSVKNSRRMFPTNPMVKKMLEAAGQWDNFRRTQKRIEDRVFASMRAEHDQASIDRFADYDCELPGHVFKYEDKLLGRVTLNKVFGKKNKRPARECEAMECFLVHFMEECGSDLTSKEDLTKFMREMALTPRDIEFLWIECGRRGYKDGEPYWPLVEKKLGHEGVWQLAWFRGGVRRTDWQEYSKVYRLLHGTPIFEEDTRPLE